MRLSWQGILLMKLSERIREKYPSNVLFTAWPPYRICLEFAAGFSAYDRERLTGALRQMNVAPEEKATAGTRLVRISLEARQGGAFRSVSCLDFKAYFEGEDWLEPMRWVVYALAWNMPWVRGCQDKTVTVRAFSARQQQLAYQFKAAVRRQLEGGTMVDDTARAIAACIQEANNSLRRLPSYAARPIRAEGWENVISPSNSWLSRIKHEERQWTLKALADQLFGRINVKEELDCWVGFLKGQPQFKEAMERAKGQIVKLLTHECQLADVGNVIERVRAIQKESDYSEEALLACVEDVEKVLKRGVIFGGIQAENLISSFAEVTSAYDRAAEKRLGRELTAVLLDETAALLMEEQNRAIGHIQQIGQDMNRFCFLNSMTLSDPLKLSWNHFRQEEIGDGLLQTETDSWTPDNFGDLTMSVPSQNLEAWLLREDLCPQMAFVHNSSFVNPVSISDRSYAVAVFAAMPQPSGDL